MNQANPLLSAQVSVEVEDERVTQRDRIISATVAIMTSSSVSAMAVLEKLSEFVVCSQ